MRLFTAVLLGWFLGLLAGNSPGLASPMADAAEPHVQACPVSPSATGDAPAQHWASPAALNLDDKAPVPCAPCSDPANASSRNCSVFRFLNSPVCAGGRCGDSQGEFLRRDAGGNAVFLQYDTRYRDPARYPGARGQNCRFVLWAVAPVTGIEDVTGYAGHNYWRAAYVASQTLVEPPFPKAGLAFAIQPAITRSQHQLHIHIGTLKAAYRAALGRLGPDATTLAINGYRFRVRFVAIPPGSDPFARIDVFAAARDMLPRGAADLPRHGVIAALAEDGRGLWILAGERFQREELNYVGPTECRLR